MDKDKLKKAIEFAKQNPESDFANELRKRIETGQIVVETEKPTYLERVGEQFENIAERTTEALKKSGEGYFEKAQSGDVLGATGELLRGGLRSVGAVTEGAFAPITEAPVIKQALDFVGEKIGNTEVGQRIAKKIQENPETAQDIMDIVNTLTLGGGKAVEAPVKAVSGEVLSKTGSAIEKGALKTIDAEKNKFIRELIRPEQTKLVKEAQVGRTVEKGSGIFKRSEILPTEQELRIEKAIATIPEVKKGNTFQQNYNVIKDANIKEAQLLEQQIADKDFIIPKKEIKSRLLQAQNNLSESPLITGDAEKMAEKLLTKANQLVDANAGSGSGLLKARKEFDAWVLSQKPKAFDATAENAFTLANREVRKTFNTLLDEKAVDVGVKESLAKQSALYNAMDNIAPKAAQEADTAIARAFNNMAKAVGIKNKAVQQIATIAGIGGLGAAATFAPAVAVGGGLAFLGYKGAKLLMKPEIRVQLGKLLQKSGHLLNPEDKAILENAIKTYSETPNKQSGFIAVPQAGNLKGEGTQTLLKKEKSISSPNSTTKSLKGKGEILETKLDTLNPTGSVFAKYTPQQRVSAKLADNITTLDKTMGKSPDEIITIYRGTSTQKNIVPGDFITTNKQLAKDYAGTGKVIEKKVKLSDILDDLNEPMGEEYIYRPKVNKTIPENSLISEAKKYKSAEKFVKKYNPVEYSFNKFPNPFDSSGEPIKTIRVELFPKDLVKGKGITKNTFLDIIKDGYSKGYNQITPSMGIWTSDGKAFMETLVRDGYIDKNYNILPKINKWKTKSQLTDIWNKANK